MNKLFLGIDTSNYTTSLALYNENGVLLHKRKLLPVSDQARGLRQSDALFLHTKALPLLSDELFDGMYDKTCLSAVGVSVKPRDVEGSYMPCFLAGVSFAHAVSGSNQIPLYSFSHQAGHIMAAAYSSGNRDILTNRFISFHVSGGTTEVLLVTPENNTFRCEIIGGTDDLNAGQAIDRTGVAMGLSFPCGAELDRLSQQSEKTYRPKISVKAGKCSLSGLENICQKMLFEGETHEDTANYLFSFLALTLEKLTEYARSLYPLLPVLYAGGVMANTRIRQALSKQNNAFFATPELSSDNACGIALLAEKSNCGGII